LTRGLGISTRARRSWKLSVVVCSIVKPSSAIFPFRRQVLRLVTQVHSGLRQKSIFNILLIPTTPFYILFYGFFFLHNSGGARAGRGEKRDKSKKNSIGENLELKREIK
jgi:hypothetical protein